MQNSPTKLTRITVTSSLVLISIIAVGFLYYYYTNRPWTRDGEVHADIISISSKVKGQVVNVTVKDNQFVKKGDLIFQIETDDYELNVEEAEVKLDQARQEVKSLIAQVKEAEANVEQGKAQLNFAEKENNRILRAVKTDAVSKALADQSIAAVDNARAKLNAYIAGVEKAKENLGVPGEGNFRIKSAKVELENAKLQLNWTSVYAPSDGYITNLNLKKGDYCNAGTPVLAFVRSESFYVYGYFKETQLEHINPGNRAVVTLMGYRDKEIEGVVDSIGRAISTPEVATTGQLIPEIPPAFDWVRLAQRIPVRINLKEIPDNINLVAGMTASVVVYPNKP